MKTIHKFQIPLKEEVAISIPGFQRILRVDQQRGTLCLWAGVDLDNPAPTVINLAVVGTGHRLPDNYDWETHLATVIVEPFVWHIFRERL